MPAVTKSAVNVTLLDADPKLMLEAGSAWGKVRVYTDTIALVTADTGDVADRWIMAEIPSNAKILSIKMYNDIVDNDATPTLDADLGIYNGNIPFTIAGTTTAAGAVIDVDAYVSAIASTTTTFLGVANVQGFELMYEARNITSVANFMWEDAGLTEDPSVPLRIAFTVTAGAATHLDGDLTVVVTYVQE